MRVGSRFIKHNVETFIPTNKYFIVYVGISKTQGSILKLNICSFKTLLKLVSIYFILKCKVAVLTIWCPYHKRKLHKLIKYIDNNKSIA